MTRSNANKAARCAARARWAKAPDRLDISDNPALARVMLLNRTQVAQVLGISVHTLDDWVKKSKFPRPLALSPGHAKKWRLIDVEIWLQRKLKKPAEKPTPRGAVKARDEARQRKRSR